jgi:predicted AlkP superfamily phosphohydrolase/phosphomutase
MAVLRKNIKCVVIGLDCAAPSLMFHEFKSKLPSISTIIHSGAWGHLRSCDPPLTIPAWACMVSGLGPGTLGCYGIHNRTGYSYRPMEVANSTWIRHDRLWDILGRHSFDSIAVAVPPTYPVSPLRGQMISCFLAPDTRTAYTYPPALKNEIASLFPGYIPDIDNYRNIPPDQLIGQIRSMTRRRFEVFRYLLRSKPWNFAMIVEIGLDRLQHCFWQFWDRTHPLHRPGNGFENTLEDYYRLLDDEVGRILDMLPDDCLILIVSDHGAQPMMGGFRINQWLIQEGYLTLLSPPMNPSRLDWQNIDWTRTTAWGEGGYMGRIFMNVKNRESCGQIPFSGYRQFRDEMKARIEGIRTPDGRLLGNVVHYPEELYKCVNGTPPDMMVYYGGLAWRSLSEVGTKELFTLHNDQGPDGANHSLHGVFIANRNARPESPLPNLSIMDITPTVLDYFGIPIPPECEGRSIPLKFSGD